MLGGVGVALALLVPFFPFVIAIAVSEAVSIRSLETDAIVRMGYGAVVIAVGLLAWRKAEVIGALLFIAMLIVGMAWIFFWHQRWIRGF